MLSYIVFKIIYNSSTLLVCEHDFIGYQLKVPKDYGLEVNKYARIYVYEHCTFVPTKNILNKEWYGFRTLGERLLFVDLIGINGIGAKTALNLLKHDLELITTAIGTNDLETLSQIKGVSLKHATLICDSLASKYANKINENKNWTKQLSLGLSNLGYDKKQIEFALQKLANLDQNLEINELIGLAIKEISLANN